ncbi:DUF7344 domain-containing protein [Halobellus rufus]|uniref:DUF7344 domain-containing protein n=1 Tax=Halobellus rufus TaxID=1448860 RepID=UPI0006787777|nr:transcriptional regulator [Halobellus rufus]
MDEYFEALANIHRRRLLVALLDHNPQRNDVTVTVPEDVYEGEKPLEVLQTEFYHSHLPQLKEAGLIRLNRDTDEVAKGPKFDEIRPLLEAVRNSADEFPNDWL